MDAYNFSARRDPEAERRRQVKDELVAEIVKTMVAADASGQGAETAARAAFPTVPDTLIYAALVEFWDHEENAWLDTLVRTIDGEVLRRAIAQTGGGDDGTA